MTQEQAAQAAGCSQSMISLLEGGDPGSFPLIRKLVRAYGVSREAAGALLVDEDPAAERAAGPSK